VAPTQSFNQPEAFERRRLNAERGIVEERTYRIDELRTLRRERVEDGGRRVIIEEPGNRTIIREGNEIVIRHDETERLRRVYGGQARIERRGEEEITIIRRPNGAEIITVQDREGNLIRRVRRETTGVETVLIENTYRERTPRTRTTYIEEVVDVPPPVVRIPREEYVVEVERASPRRLVETLEAPPVERIERTYTLDQVRRTPALRERMRRIDLDTVTFASGSWQVAENQVDLLASVADAIRRVIANNPNEIFLIEGHTDAVGSDEDNLTLSDRRAESVALILTERYQIPAENLTTQGYGEKYLKINTGGDEPENRRVTVRRITPLLQNEAQRR
jgi:outer membrane protein OmpA-like peptidoglycan-associated protein